MENITVIKKRKKLPESNRAKLEKLVKDIAEVAR